jgi:hypothetical protein
MKVSEVKTEERIFSTMGILPVDQHLTIIIVKMIGHRSTNDGKLLDYNARP